MSCDSCRDLGRRVRCVQHGSVAVESWVGQVRGLELCFSGTDVAGEVLSDDVAYPSSAEHYRVPWIGCLSRDCALHKVEHEKHRKWNVVNGVVEGMEFRLGVRKGKKVVERKKLVVYGDRRKVEVPKLDWRVVLGKWSSGETDGEWAEMGGYGRGVDGLCL